MTDIANDPTLLAVETTVDTKKSEEGFAALLENMSKQSQETAGFLKELGEALKDLVSTVVEKGAAAEQAVVKATQSTQKQQVTIQEELGKLKAETGKQLHDIETLYEEYGIKASGSLEQAAKTYENAIKKVKDNAVKGILTGTEAKQLLEELEHDAESIYKRLEEQKRKGVGELLKDKAGDIPLGVGKGLSNTIQSATSGLLSAIPKEVLEGGIVGLFLYGMGADEASRAEIATVGQSFRDQVNQTTTDVIGSTVTISTAFDVTAQKLHVANKELGSVYQSLGHAGMSAKEAGFSTEQLNKAFDGVNITTAGLQENLGILTVAIDKSFNLQTGQTAKEAVAMARELGTSVQHAAEQMGKLRIAAQASGEDIDRYMNSVLGASKALAQYGIDVGAATNLLDAFRAKDTETHGAQAAIAMQGVGQAFSNIAGNAGMAAYLGEQIVKREGSIGSGSGAYAPGAGQAVDPLEARRQLLLGFGKQGPEGSKVLADVITEMQHIAREQGRSPAQQEFAIEKLFGVNTTTAEMINRLSSEQIKGIREGKNVGGLTKEELEKIRGGFETSRERENAFEEFIKQALKAIGDLLQGIFLGVAGIAAYVASFLGADTKDSAKQLFTSAKQRLFGTAAVVAQGGIEMFEHEKSNLGLGDLQPGGHAGVGGRSARDHASAAAISSALAAGHGSSGGGVPGSAGSAAGAGGLSYGTGSASSSGTASYDPGQNAIVARVNVVIPHEAITTARRVESDRRGSH